MFIPGFQYASRWLTFSSAGSAKNSNPSASGRTTFGFSLPNLARFASTLFYGSSFVDVSSSPQSSEVPILRVYDVSAVLSDTW
jgi:hypothetical protein